MLVDSPILGVLALACLVAAVIWGRSARRLLKAARRLEATESGARGVHSSALARAAFRRELHNTLLYALLALGLGISAFSPSPALDLPLLTLLAPIVLTLSWGRRFLAEARLAEERALIERRAEEMLAQEQTAPMRWAARLAPPGLPAIEGFEVATVYEPGAGVMAGDFYDVYPTGPNRLASVIGDVAGHGIDPSITAFQVKYLLRVFLRQYRDPAQALEELNTLLSNQDRGAEEMVSLCVVVFDQTAHTLRVASAGHPPVWLWHDGEVRPLGATGPLLTLDPEGGYFSREVPLDPGDLVVLYTDGLTEARSGDRLFGDERVADILRRDPGEDVSTLCKNLLEAAREFADEALTDDVAILAVRKL